MKKIIVIMMGFTLCQAQDSGRLTNDDLKAAFTDETALKFMKQVNTFALQSDTQAYFNLSENKKAKKQLNDIMAFRAKNEEFMEFVKLSNPRLYQNTEGQREKMQDVFFHNHLRLTCAYSALQKCKSKKDSTKVQSKNTVTNIFVRLGSLVTSKEFSEDKFQTFIDDHLAVPEDSETAKIFNSYKQSFMQKKSDLVKRIDSEKLTQSIACTIADHYQSVVQDWEKYELAHDKEYRQRTIQNGKKITVGLGVVMAAAGTAAWLWSKQSTK